MGDATFGRRAILAALAAAAFTFCEPAHAAAGIPVRVRILKGLRQGPPAVDPAVADLQPQLSRLAYQRWEQAASQQTDVELNKPMRVALPGGETLELTLVDLRKETVTFTLRVGAKAHSKLTISKDQRIVHQVTDEKDGAAYFATIRPWP